MTGILARVFDGEAGRGVYIVGGITLGAVTAGTVYLVLKRRFDQFMSAGETDRSTLTNTDFIYLFTPPRLGVVPNISPFAIKLEVWFRLIGVPFKVVETLQSSANKQFPYIMLDGEEIADTRFIVEKVSEHFGKPLYPGLSAEERAVSVGFSRMLEENTFFTYVWYRYLCSPEDYWGLFKKEGVLAQKLLKYAPGSMTRPLKKKLWEQGTARLAPSEIHSLAETDLKALSDYLGTKEYFFGNGPSLIDCVAFAHLIQILLIKINFPPRFYVIRECKNLVAFVDRMKNRMYPDWDELCNI